MFNHTLFNTIVLKYIPKGYSMRVANVTAIKCCFYDLWVHLYFYVAITCCHHVRFFLSMLWLDESTAPIPGVAVLTFLNFF